MTDRPILMSAPMVLACLREVEPKTQTRRIVKPQPETVNHGRLAYIGVAAGTPHPIRCPYGVPGDTLWVRETLRRSEVGPWVYRADDEPVEMRRDDPRITEMVGWAHHKEGDVCVSIHMPRWASRISLRITDVRVERLNEISCVDAMAEGITSRLIECADGAERNLWFGVPQAGNESPVQAYADLWDSINNPNGYCAEDEPRGWAANPWVWAVSFEVAREPQANTGHTNGNSGNTPDQAQRP